MSNNLDLENGQEANINTPLLAKEKNSNEDNIKALMVEKGKSRVKWVVFFLLFFNSIALYQCSLSVSAVQDSLMKLYDWNSTQYSIIIFMVPGIAFFSTIFSPALINAYSVDTVQLWSFIFLTVGQLLTFTGVKYYENRQSSYGMLYSGRALVGICLGINEVGLLTNLFLWFNETEWMGALSSLIFSAVEVGSLISRYAETPLVNKYNDVSLAFTYGIGFGVLSVIGQLVLMYYDRQFRQKLMKEKNLSKSALHYTIERDYSLIFKKFGFTQWSLCFAFMIAAGICIVYYLQMTVPVMKKYGVSESYANLMLSTTSLLIVISTPTIGMLMMLKRDVLVSIGGMLFVILGLTFFFIPENMSNVTLGWFSIAFFGLGCPIIIASIMNALFASLSPELISVTNAMNSFGYFAVTAILSILFGVIEDKYTESGAVSIFIAGLVVVIVIIFPLVFKNLSRKDPEKSVEAI